MVVLTVMRGCRRPMHASPHVTIQATFGAMSS